jgi:hypothetical protein
VAATIVTTPSLGASDWSNFITQVAGLKKGFMQLSYTNFAGTVESAIATGGVMEVNGSFYQFTETVIDYSGTTSAAADLYIYAQPSAGGTTLTIAALTAACVWVDSKQGFYASAASNNRAIGGMRVQTAATYYNKYVYDISTVENCLHNTSTRPFMKCVIPLGEWNMDSALAGGTYPWPSTATVNALKIRQMSGIIYDDTLAVMYPIPYLGIGNTVESIIGPAYMTSGVAVQRKTSGFFDSASFDGTASTVPNRGYVIVTYEA